MINELKINLACGQNKIEGFFGIDYVQTKVTDAVMDLEKYPWDIESDSAQELFCSHYVEHIPHDSLAKDIISRVTNNITWEDFRQSIIDRPPVPTDSFFRFFDEVYRILKVGGTFKVISPYYSSMRAWQDPTHTRAISDATFFYLNKNWRDINMLDHYGVTCDFDFTYGHAYEQEWESKHDEARGVAVKRYNNVVNDIHCFLTKRALVEVKPVEIAKESKT